jgi:hypothetical protein
MRRPGSILAKLAQRRWRLLALALVLVIATSAAWAQRFSGRSGRGRGWGWGEGGGDTGIMYTEPPYQVRVNVDTVRTAREIAAHSTEPANWTNAPGFAKDAFTFARVIYRRGSDRNGTPRSASGKGWMTDFPDSDLNLSYRLQQVTAMKVDPDGRVLRLTDPDLFNYPWIYMVEPGGLQLKEEEIPALRRYLLSGGVLMADDFWGQSQWDNFERNMRLVLPDREFVELPMDHPIFHCVFDLKVPKNKLQTPNVGQGIECAYATGPERDITWEYYHDDGEGTRDLHVRAMLDEQQRIMVIATHNTDNGDGWEREGEDDRFFHEFSEKRAYPLGINLIYYLMTH